MDLKYEGGMNWDMYRDIHAACFEIAKRKNAAYGTKGLLSFKGLSILIRMNDKIDRLNNLMENPELDILKDETIEDTLMDLINYSTYFIMLRRGGGIQ